MMTARTKGTITATLILLFYGFGIAWWWTYQPPDLSRQAEIWNQYKMTRMQTH